MSGRASRSWSARLSWAINFFDTADVYGNPQRKGLTEALIGRWLAQGGGRRERIVLATKLFSPIGPEINDRGLSAYHIRRACEGSLRRLQTDHIDLYQMHHIDRGRPTTSQLDWFGTERELVFPAHIDPAPSMGGDLARHGAGDARRQDHLCRQQ